MISIRATVSRRGTPQPPTQPSTTMASRKARATRSTHKPCGSSLQCVRCTSRSPTRRRWQAAEDSLRPIAPLVTAGPNGPRARSSTATIRAVAQNGAPLDPGVTRLPPVPPAPALANEFFSFTCNGATFKYLEDVGTFDVTNPLELRDNATGSTAFGTNGFNVAIPAQHQLSRAVLASWSGANAGRRISVTQPARGRNHCEHARRIGSAEFARISEIHRWDDRATAIRGDDFRDTLRLQGTCPTQP